MIKFTQNLISKILKFISLFVKILDLLVEMIKKSLKACLSPRMYNFLFYKPDFPYITKENEAVTVYRCLRRLVDRGAGMSQRPVFFPN